MHKHKHETGNGMYQRHILRTKFHKYTTIKTPHNTQFQSTEEADIQ